jgi:hypothetical protein
MKLQEIEIGKDYLMTSVFGSNKVVKLSDDYTGLNRDIAYFRYADRGCNLTPQAFAHQIECGNVVGVINKVFAMWQFELDFGGTTLTPLADQPTTNNRAGAVAQ